jgi:hypothetical protein
MKNKLILPKKLVPKKIRFKLYQQAYQDLKNNTKVVGLMQPLGLCISLPIYLWDLDGVAKFAPNGEDWYTDDTPKMFPELAKELNRLEIPKGSFMLSSDRIAFLERILNINPENHEQV